jgi:colanic acid/amylovoran biosynthesis glycosyltransferase
MITANPECTLHILTAAEMTWQNGFEFGIQAIALLLQQGVSVEYRIVGQGDFLEAVACARHDLGLDAVIQILVEDYKSKLDEHLNWADVFLLAAVAHTNKHGLLDAIMKNKPVVATDVFEAELQKTKSIRVVTRRDSIRLAQALNNLSLQHSIIGENKA